MASVHDVAAYILEHRAPMTTWKLQKLVYYCQAWHVVWDDQLLFDESIEAWANGPVVWELFNEHRGRFQVADWPSGDSNNLADNERATIEAVLASYGDLTGRQLSHLTHDEGPWRDARGDLAPTARSRLPIDPGSMQAFYDALDADATAPLVGDLDWGSLGS